MSYLDHVVWNGDCSGLDTFNNNNTTMKIWKCSVRNVQTTHKAKKVFFVLYQNKAPPQSLTKTFLASKQARVWYNIDCLQLD